MVYKLLNKKNEKVLTASIISRNSLSSYFEKPNFYGIFFFKKAEGSISLDGVEYDVGNSSVYFFYPYQKMFFTGIFKGAFIQFHPDFFCIDIHAKDVGCQGLLFNNFFKNASLECSPEEYLELFEFYKGIQLELERKEPGQLDMVSSHLKMFLIKSVRIKKENLKEEFPIKDNLYYQIEKLINDNYKTQSSSGFYINALGVSLTTFNRLCKKYFQQSFITILNLKRIAYTKNKLFLTNLPVKEIAFKAGYNDPLYFSRVFKKYSGVSPKEFRNQLKNNRLI